METGRKSRPRLSSPNQARAARRVSRGRLRAVAETTASFWLGLRQLLEVVPAQAFVFDLDGRPVPLNERARDHLAMASEDSVCNEGELRRVEISAGGLAAVVMLRHDPSQEQRRRCEALRHEWRLTPRQLEVLGLMVHGQSNKQIAAALDCAEATVERHVTAILEKSAAESRAEVVATFWKK